MNILDIYPDITEAPVEIRMSRAKASDTPPEVLATLSRDPFWYVRDLVASNINTPRESLEELLQDPDFRINGDAKKTIEAKEQKQDKPSLISQIQHASNKLSSEPHLKDQEPEKDR